MFFLSQTGKELVEVIRETNNASDLLNDQLQSYQILLEDLRHALAIYIHKEGPYPDEPETEKKIINYHEILNWSMMDWKLIDKDLKSEEENWFCVVIARGGFIVFEDVESKVEKFMISYYKPRTKLKSHEDSSIYEEYTDIALEDKLAEFANQEVNLILIDDIIDDGREIDLALEAVIEMAEEMNVVINKTVVLSLLTRIRHIGQTPVYGTLIDYSGDIFRDWGNDFEDGLDYHDFTPEKEYIDDL